MSKLYLADPSGYDVKMNEIARHFSHKVEVYPPGSCPITMQISMLRTAANQTCGKCVPCRDGLPLVARLMQKVLDGRATEKTLDNIRMMATMIRSSADCAIGWNAADEVLKGLDLFADEYQSHIENKKCLESIGQKVPCISLCPAHVNIPGYIALVGEEDYAGAINLIRKDNPFPTACAMVCEHPCEERCRRKMLESPINIRALKKYAVDMMPADKVATPKPNPSTGKSIGVIGGGPAGLASATAAKQNGAKSVLIIERDKELGGILNQCIHNGFGLHHFKEELTGPEYAGKYIDEVNKTDIDILLDTMVIDITPDKMVYCSSSIHGYLMIQAKSIILNMGCRERTRGAIAIPGTRASGVFTAGAAQRYVNIEGYMPGKRVVILGSGDIGLIMARRMTLEGAKVLAVVEVMPYSNGLNRNIVQCLHDYDIPLYLSHTITDIVGKSRVEKVVVSKVDENRNPIEGTEMEFDCDCVLLSVGLIPENELSNDLGVEMDSRTHGPIVYENMETSMEGVFASGNVVHVHDLVDFVSLESEKAGMGAGRYVLNGEVSKDRVVKTINGDNISYVVPQYIRKDNVEKSVELSFRVRRPTQQVNIVVRDGDTVIAKFKKEHVIPSEMEKISIPKVLLEKADKELVVSVKEDA